MERGEFWIQTRAPRTVYASYPSSIEYKIQKPDGVRESQISSESMKQEIPGKSRSKYKVLIIIVWQR